MVCDPEVSIVVPCYNAASTLRQTLASARAQVGVSFEIIAVDDGSTDGTAGLLMECAAQNRRVRVVRRRNGGLAAARNSGIAAARGRFIALLDADDLIDPGYIAAHVANLNASDADVSFGRVRYIDRDGRPTGAQTNPKLRDLEPRDFLVSNPCTSFLVIRRDLFDRIGAFNETFRRVEDQEWLFRVSHGGARISGIAEVLASYRITPGSLSADTPAMERAFDAMLEAARAIAPDLVARSEHSARARLLRYCARRIIDHGGNIGEARAKMHRALWLDRSMIASEPKSTLATLLAVHVPRLAPLLFAHRQALGKA